jgi:hypothetical protein
VESGSARGRWEARCEIAGFGLRETMRRSYSLKPPVRNPISALSGATKKYLAGSDFIDAGLDFPPSRR